MENKKTKLTLSGIAKKSIENIELAKTQSKNSVVIEKKILNLTDFADLASDELTGGYDVIKGERIKIQGYLEDFALSKTEADELIMSARNIIYKD